MQIQKFWLLKASFKGKNIYLLKNKEISYREMEYGPHWFVSQIDVLEPKIRDCVIKTGYWFKKHLHCLRVSHRK